MQITVHIEVNPKAASVVFDGVDPGTAVDVGVAAKEEKESSEYTEEEPKK